VPLARAYHCPTDLAEALDLLAEPRRVALAGGTVLNADRVHSDIEFVDLRRLGLDEFTATSDTLSTGAMVDLDRLLTGCGDELIAEACRRELPSTLRTLGTVGGTVMAGGGDSVLLAAMIVSNAQALTAEGISQPVSEMPTGLVFSVAMAVGGTTSLSATGRTPMDVPIVAAVGRRIGDSVAVAVTGVASRPHRVDPSDPTANLAPPDDFRGSAAYRLELVDIHVRRVMEELS